MTILQKGSATDGRRPGFSIDCARMMLNDANYGLWRDYDPEDTVRFFALRLHEAGVIENTPNEVVWIHRLAFPRRGQARVEELSRVVMRCQRMITLDVRSPAGAGRRLRRLVKKRENSTAVIF